MTEQEDYHTKVFKQVTAELGPKEMKVYLSWWFGEMPKEENEGLYGKWPRVYSAMHETISLGCG